MSQSTVNRLTVVFDPLTTGELRRLYALFVVVCMSLSIVVLDVVMTDDMLYYRPNEAAFWSNVMDVLAISMTLATLYVIVRFAIRRDVDAATLGLVGYFVVQYIVPSVTLWYGTLVVALGVLAYEFVKEDDRSSSPDAS